MDFKVRDLMVRVLPQTAAERPGVIGGTITAAPCTCITRCGVYTECGFFTCFGTCECTLTCTPGSCTTSAWCAAPTPQARAEVLAQLREQLRRQLEQVDSEGATLEEALRPQTVAQVDLLERKLRGALDDLEGQRAALRSAGRARQPRTRAARPRAQRKR